MASAPVPDLRVALLYDLEAQIAVLQEKRQAIAAELIKLGEGTYSESSGPGARTALVVIPTKYSTKYDLYAAPALARFLATRDAKKATPALRAEFIAAQEAAAESLAGEHFKTLFDRVVLRKPTDGFEKLVPKLLTTAKGEASAKARELLLLCQIVTPPKDPYLRLPDKPKKTGDAEPEEE